MTYLLFAASLIGIAVYSWGYVDANAPFMRPESLTQLVYHNGNINGAVYTLALLVLFAWYGYIVRGVLRKTIRTHEFLRYLGILIAVLLFSYPAFSNDVFNYIATARMTFLYRENPYLIMPIDIPNEPMLAFMHAANKVALYGPTWILATFVPYVAGFGNLLATVYAFKVFVAAWLLLLGGLIWKLTRRLSAVALFMFNPLVIVNTLIDGHNDVMMMALALLAFYLLRNKQVLPAWVILVLSVFVKGATVFLVPVFFYAGWVRYHGTVDWDKIWLWAAYSMFAVFLLSPIREEMYSWYFIWVLSFLSLRKSWDAVTAVGIGFSFGLPLRFLPFAITRNWAGITPMIKNVVTVTFPVVAWFWYILVQRMTGFRNSRKR